MKQKTHSGAKKRFWKTGSGKIKYKRAGQRHLMTGNAANQARKMRKSGILSDSDTRTITRLLDSK